ncbi:hypothetical protein [Actinosynnema mirum]|nr:hypothetical protein [Actinosynnema mirum]
MSKQVGAARQGVGGQARAGTRGGRVGGGPSAPREPRLVVPRERVVR